MFYINLVFFDHVPLLFFYNKFCYFFFDFNKVYRLFLVYFFYFKFRLLSYDFNYLENIDNFFVYTKQPKRWEYVNDYYPLNEARFINLLMHYDETEERSQDFYRGYVNFNILFFLFLNINIFTIDCLII